MAAPVFGSISAVGNSTTGNFTFSQPAGAASGDLLVAFVACKGDTFTFPTGWTTLLSVAGTSSNGGLRVAYIVRGATAPALTVSGRGSADICLFQVARFTGFDPANPMSLLQNASNTSPVNTSGTVSLSVDDMVVMAFGSGSNATFASYTDSSGQITPWTERGDNGTTNGSNTQLAIATAVVPTGTIDPYGPFQATGGSGTSTIGVFVINAAPSGGTTNVSLTPSAVGANALVKRVSTAKAATAAGVASILRAFPKALAYAANGTNALLKRVAKPLAASAAGVSTLARLTVKLISFAYAAVGTASVLVNLSLKKLLAAAAIGTATVQKRVGKVLAAVGLGTSGVRRRINIAKAAVAVGLANLTRTSVKLIGLAFAAVGSLSFSAIRAILRSFATAATGTSSLLKSVRKTIARTASGVSALIKQVRLPRAFAGLGTVTFNDLLVKLVSLAISAVGTSTVISKKVFIASYGYIAVGVNTLTKRIAKTIAATALGLGNVLKQVRLPRATAALGTAAFSFKSVAIRTFSAVAVGIVTFTKNFFGGFAGPAQKVYKRGRFIMNNFGRW